MIPEPLSAKVTGSFAYLTVKDRLPAILTKIIDTTHRQINELPPDLRDDAKAAIGKLSELRYRIATNKPMLPLVTDQSDKAAWTRLYEEQEEQFGEPAWFKNPWLFIECYMYRRIANVFEASVALPGFDPFQYLKNQAFIGSLSTIHAMAKYVMGELKKESSHDSKVLISNLIQMALWSNRCDLSISSGNTDIAPGDLLSQLTTLRQDYILVDEVDALVDHLCKKLDDEPNPANSKNTDDQSMEGSCAAESSGQELPTSLKPGRQSTRRIDIVLDNAGYELFCDLCLVEALLRSGCTDKVVLHGKVMPWFVSDTTAKDFAWTLEMCRDSDCPELNELGHKIHDRLDAGEIVFTCDPFWTLPCDFTRMPDLAPELHNELSTESRCVIFKGDLNYRKLVGDLAWPSTTHFRQALRGLKLGRPRPGDGRPSPPIASLRTLKANVVVGLKEGVADKLTEDSKGSEDWMTTGKYGVVHFLET